MKHEGYYSAETAMTDTCTKSRSLQSKTTTVIKMKHIRGSLLASCLFFGGLITSQATPVQLDKEQIEATVKKIAAELNTACPIAAPDSQIAFDKCRQFLFNDSLLKRSMAEPVILWGRQKDSSTPLKETNLTQFRPEILSGMYIPLFMFDGKYKITFNEKEKLYLASMGVGFRNRLQPGQFPYPFWHEANKWNMYENARSLLLWIHPVTGKIRAAQFTPEGEAVAGYKQTQVITPAFDGKWLWTDDKGKTQPAVTLFDGLYREDNPYKQQLDQSYREFAIALRESQCLSCHVPNNPEKMKRLVLLQSPAHASGEIQRVLKSVRDKKMPLDEQGIEKELDPQLEKTLLEKGGAFEKIVNAAREWERQQLSQAH